MGYKNDDLCLKKVNDDEPIFVLRAQDISSTFIVLEWIKINFQHTPDDKLREAFEHALKMKNYPSHKIPD